MSDEKFAPSEIVDELKPKKAGFTTDKQGRVRLQPAQLRLQAGTLRQVSDDIAAVLMVTAAIRRGASWHDAVRLLSPCDEWVHLAYFNAAKGLSLPGAQSWDLDSPPSEVEVLMAVFAELAIAYRKAASNRGQEAMLFRTGRPRRARPEIDADVKAPLAKADDPAPAETSPVAVIGSRAAAEASLLERRKPATEEAIKREMARMRQKKRRP